MHPHTFIFLVWTYIAPFLNSIWIFACILYKSYWRSDRRSWVHWWWWTSSHTTPMKVAMDRNAMLIAWSWELLVTWWKSKWIEILWVVLWLKVGAKLMGWKIHGKMGWETMGLLVVCVLKTMGLLVGWVLRIWTWDCRVQKICKTRCGVVVHIWGSNLWRNVCESICVNLYIYIVEHNAQRLARFYNGNMPTNII